MGKPPKKKGGKKDTPKEEPPQSSLSMEEPSTSEPPEAEEEDDVGLTGAARKRKEKKEKKERAMQALQASRKPSSVSESSKTASEVLSEQPSRAQSEALSEPPSDFPPEAPIKPAKAIEEPKNEEAEDTGLGLVSSKKKRPRKKKADSQPSASQPPAAQLPSTQQPAVQQPAAEQPAAEQPASQQPEAQQPAAQQPAAQQPAAQQPAAQQPAAQQSSQEVWAVTSDLGALSLSDSSVTSPVSGSGPAPVPTQQSEPVIAPPAGAWFAGPPPGVGRGRGRGTTTGPPASAGRGSGRGTSTGPPADAGRSDVTTTGPPPSQSPIPTPSPTRVTKQQAVAQTSATQSERVSTRPPKSLDPVLCRYKIPTKIPGGVVRARGIQVLVNYLEMDFKSLIIYRYDVSFTPERPKRMLPEAFAIAKAKYFAKDLIAFDQMKNCYSLYPLRGVTSTERFSNKVEIIDQNGRPLIFEVALKSTGVVDLGNIRNYMTSRGSSLCHPTEEIQCIDVILRQGALESYVKAGRQFFRRPRNPVDLGYGYEMWTGLFQSAIFTNKAFINVDVAHKGFPKHQSLLDALIKDFNLDPNRPVEHQRGGDYFVNFVKGLRVTALLVGQCVRSGDRREFVANGIVAPPRDLYFTIDEKDGRSRKTSVADYFANDKQFRIKYPNLNCVWVGSREKTIYFPIELLTVREGQPLARQLNEIQVSKMVKEAATPPDVRLRKITEVVENMQYSKNPNFKKFGLEISDQYYSVQAKVLDAPTLDTGNRKTTPRNGQWQANRLLKPEPLLSWCLIAVDTDPRNEYDSMIDFIIKTGNQMGMKVANPKFVIVNGRMQTLHADLLKARGIVSFVFVIVSARGKDDYHKVKQLAEREVGILTQCVKEATARRMNMMTAKNIMLKVNSKLMGINQALDSDTMPKCLKDGGVMVVGADVTHPSPDQSNVPSIAAVTASMDPNCYIYNIELSIQTPKKEMIVEFQDMMFDHLKLYKERNRNTLPRKIFVFRDGVSEGQFSQVMNSELAAVHAAYHRMAGPNKKPEVLFLLVQKRHHTRLFNEGANARFNVEPGTVVDTDIVHASELDFYLVSHQAIKGTARPTRYHAVCNDGKIPDDEVEQLTYYLCHLYSRCMRSVSYPTPTYYAHLACLRARSLTHGEKFNNQDLEKAPKRLRVLDKMLQYSRMFFV